MGRSITFRAALMGSLSFAALLAASHAGATVLDDKPANAPNSDAAQQIAQAGPVAPTSAQSPSGGSVTEPGSAAQPRPSDQLEEIVVTAQKRKENLQNVPISITAVTSQAIENAHATDLNQLNGEIPNVQLAKFTNQSQASVFIIRGVGVSDADPYVGTAVSVVVDGVVQQTQVTAGQDLFDVDRIEVLRGPQGTLFGANTTGGVINIVTKQPTGVYGGDISAEVGNYSHVLFDAALDFPIVPNVLAGKVTLEYNRRDGFFQNVVDGQRVGGLSDAVVRPYLKWTPNGIDLDSTLILQYDHDRDGAPIIQNGGNPGYAAYNPSFHVPPLTYDVGDNEPDTTNNDIYSATWTTNWRSPVGTITSITGFRTYDQLQYEDQDGTPAFLTATYRTIQASQFSEELRDSYNPIEDVQVTSGVYLSNFSYKLRQTFLQQAFLPGLTNALTEHEDDLSSSAFTQAYWNITPKLQVQGGVRATYEKIHMVDYNGNYIGPNGMSNFNLAADTPLPSTIAPNSSPAPGGFMVGGNHSWGLLGFKAGIDYHFLPNASTYFTFSRGFKSGGFSGRIALPQDIGPYNPEYVNAYEVGVKSDWLDHKLRVNFDVFLNDYENQQLTDYYYVGRNQSSTIVNAGTSQTKGAELEIDAVPFDGLTLNISAGYLYAAYSKFSELRYGAIENVAGFPLQYSPRWNTSVGGTYRFPAGPGDAALNLNYSYTSHEYTSITDYPDEQASATNYVTGNLSWTPDNGSWTVGLYCTNCTDRKYISSALDVVGYLRLVQLNSPQEYGVNFKYRLPEAESPGEPVTAAAPPPPPAPPSPPEAPAPQPETQRAFQVFFDFDKSNVTDAAARVIQQAATSIKEGHRTRIVVTGHTDTVGSIRYNQKLSERRAEAVKQQLIGDGVSSGDIVSRGVGKTGLLVPTPDGVREPQNRRAEIIA